MEFQTLPIVGVDTENGAWWTELNSFCHHGNPAKTYTNLLNMFGDPNHTGLLASLLFMKQRTLQDSGDSGFTQMRQLAQKAAEITGELFAKLTNSKATETPSVIFKTCKERFADALLSLCNCPDCRRTAAALAAFQHPGRLPKLTPHAKKCPNESKLTPLYNASLLSGWIDLDEEKLRDLSADVDMFWDFENAKEMALLSSILYISYCHYLLSRLHVGVINFIDDRVRKIVEFSSGHGGECVITRALEMINNHSRGTADLHVPVNSGLLKHRPQDPLPPRSLVSDPGHKSSLVSGRLLKGPLLRVPSFSRAFKRGLQPSVSRVNKGPLLSSPDGAGSISLLMERDGVGPIRRTDNSMTLDNDEYVEHDVVPGVPLIPLILSPDEEGSDCIFDIPDDSVVTAAGIKNLSLTNCDSINSDEDLENEEDFFDPLEDNDDAPEYLDLDEFNELLYMNPSELSFKKQTQSAAHKSGGGELFNPYFRQLV